MEIAENTCVPLTQDCLFFLVSIGNEYNHNEQNDPTWSIRSSSKPHPPSESFREPPGKKWNIENFRCTVPELGSQNTRVSFASSFSYIGAREPARAGARDIIFPRAARALIKSMKKISAHRPMAARSCVDSRDICRLTERNSLAHRHDPSRVTRPYTHMYICICTGVHTVRVYSIWNGRGKYALRGINGRDVRGIPCRVGAALWSTRCSVLRWCGLTPLAIFGVSANASGLLDMLS